MLDLLLIELEEELSLCQTIAETYRQWNEEENNVVTENPVTDSLYTERRRWDIQTFLSSDQITVIKVIRNYYGSKYDLTRGMLFHLSGLARW